MVGSFLGRYANCAMIPPGGGQRPEKCDLGLDILPRMRKIPSMLFMEPNETPYDLRWRMLGTDVRVHPMFWLVSVIMGANTLRRAFSICWSGSAACSYRS